MNDIHNIKKGDNEGGADLIRRPRRLRKNALLRSLVRETTVAVDDLIYPMFVTYDRTEPILSMPGIYRYCVEDLCREVEKLPALGIPAIILFGIPECRDEVGSSACDSEGIVPTAFRAIRKTVGDSLLLVADICLCEYTSHGHCGILRDGEVDNDATLVQLAIAARVCTEAGADIIAPSDMMDGRVAAIRAELDCFGYSGTPIMSYAAKYASAFYGPFREAAGSTPQFGDRKGYQMDPANRREAMREVELDVLEGADILMVKPAMPCLDIIREVRDSYDLPIAAYNVSGEYAMIKAAAMNGWLDERRAVSETLTSIKRAGADIILTYHAMEYARWVQEC